MKPKIVFLDAQTMILDGLSLASLKDFGDVTLYESTDRNAVIKNIGEAEIVLSNKVLIDEVVLKACPNIKYIIVCATGYNNIDINACREHSISVSNVSSYSTSGVVQHTFALLLHHLNKVGYYDEWVRQGNWSESGCFSFYDHSIRELQGKTIGIYGYGTIGKRVGEVAHAFGMDVIAYSRNPKKEVHTKVKMVELDELWRMSDIISLHAPLNQDSLGVINEKVIDLMKVGAILINTGRGGLINNKDLITGISNNKISYAGIDTLDVEPPNGDHPLLNSPKVTITPHQGWATKESRERLLEGIIENLKGYSEGKPINLVC